MMDRQKIVDELTERLDDVIRNATVKPLDDFDKGIDCRLANEEMWLRDLLVRIEKIGDPDAL